MQAANREIGVPGFHTQIPPSTSESGYREVTFAPYRRLSLNPARAPAVLVVLLPLEAELLVSAERPLAVFRIDADDKSLQLLWPAARILRQGSAERGGLCLWSTCGRGCTCCCGGAGGCDWICRCAGCGDGSCCCGGGVCCWSCGRGCTCCCGGAGGCDWICRCAGCGDGSCCCGCC